MSRVKKVGLHFDMEMLRVASDIETSAKTLEDLCTELKKQTQPLKRARKTLVYAFNVFDDIDYSLSDSLGNCMFGNIIIENYDLVKKTVLKGINNYLGVIDAFNSPPFNGKIEHVNFDNEHSDARDMRTALKAHDLLGIVLGTFIETKLNVPQLVGLLYNEIAAYNKYLRDRFVKSNETPKLQTARILVVGEEEQRAKYTKIKLMDGNPVLTEVMLSIMEKLPEYKERTVREKGRNKKLREVSNFGVSDSVDHIIAFSSPKILEYIKDPKKFFAEVASGLRIYYDVVVPIL